MDQKDPGSIPGLLKCCLGIEKSIVGCQCTQLEIEIMALAVLPGAKTA